MGMKDTAAAKTDASDDAFIIAVASAAQADGLVVQFDEAITNEETTTVSVSIRSTLTVPKGATVAHGRRLALAALVQ